jgi:very-short-patch-repair endonuclease
MEIDEWVVARGGIVARAVATEAGFTARAISTATRAGAVRVVRRRWLAAGTVSTDALTAARAGGLIACVSAARRRGWWMPPTADQRLHLRLAPGSASDGIPRPFDGRVHWTKALAPASRHSLLESVEDTLAHVARCLTPENALVVWESAVRVERLDAPSLRSVRWGTPAARACAEAVGGLSDSGLETILTTGLRALGLSVRQQVVIAGRPVDSLIGRRLVIQTDGWEFHSSSSQRSADIAHDAELRLRGYTVFRFSYAQIVHDWPSVEATVRRAVAAGLHL